MLRAGLILILSFTLFLTGAAAASGMAQSMSPSRHVVNDADTLTAPSNLDIFTQSDYGKLLEAVEIASGRTASIVDKSNLRVTDNTAAGKTQSACFNYPDFSSTDGLNLIGSATTDTNKLRLTDLNHQAGAVWQTNPQLVRESFETTFQFRITDTVFNGADGFAFVIQNTSTSTVGSWGSGIGYDGITNSLAIEFDTYKDDGRNDPNDNHISVQTCGSAPNSADHYTCTIGFTTAIADISDGSVHTATIEYANDTLRVFLNDLTTPVLTVPLDLAGTLDLENGQAWVGFTAGTSAAYEVHDVLNWSFCTSCISVNIDDLHSDSPVMLGEVTHFTANVTGTAPITYTWDFGGPGTRSGKDTNPTYKYDAAGTYTVTLVVTNACGTDSDFITVTVISPCSPVSITDLASDSPVGLGEAMHFTATVTGTVPITYSWDFGGAGTPGGTDAKPTFTYDAAGTYTFTLVVTNACGVDSGFIKVTVLPVYYTLTMAITGTGSGKLTPTVGTHTYFSGAMVTITATASPGSMFAGWNGAATSMTNPATITMNCNKVVTAVFTSRVLLVGQVMEERSVEPPSTTWEVTMTARFSQAGNIVYTLITRTDASGMFTITEDIADGIYDICVKPMHALARCQAGEMIPISAGEVITFGTAELPCFEGDANEDNIIDIEDFTLWKKWLMTVNPVADFNNDGIVDIDDFTIWKRNMLKPGDDFEEK